MKIKAVAFDIGNTLVRYTSPLNWKALYRPALLEVMDRCGVENTEERVLLASRVLSKYNTRENLREHEVDSQVIFEEVFQLWHVPADRIPSAKDAFYGYFQQGAVCFPEAEGTLKSLLESGLGLGALTDVAYGMDNRYSLRDIAPVRAYFHTILTSVDVGFRKPHPAGYLQLAKALHIMPSEMGYVGDEEKDIAGANRVGAVSICIDRAGGRPDFGQRYTISTLSQLVQLL